MTADWNRAAGQWNQASSQWKNYRAPQERKPLEPVGERRSPPGCEPPTCKSCRYVVCSCKPAPGYMYTSTRMRELADALTVSLDKARISDSKRRYNEHWALEQMCRGLILQLCDDARCQIRIEPGVSGRIEVRALDVPWKQGLPVVEWMTAIRSGYRGGYELFAPKPMPALPDAYQQEMAKLQAAQQKQANKPGTLVKASPMAQAIEAGLKVNERHREEQLMQRAVQEHAKQVENYRRAQDQAFILREKGYASTPDDYSFTLTASTPRNNPFLLPGKP